MARWLSKPKVALSRVYVGIIVWSRLTVQIFQYIRDPKIDGHIAQHSPQFGLVVRETIKTYCQDSYHSLFANSTHQSIEIVEKAFIR